LRRAVSARLGSGQNQMAPPIPPSNSRQSRNHTIRPSRPRRRAGVTSVDDRMRISGASSGKRVFPFYPSHIGFTGTDANESLDISADWQGETTLQPAGIEVWRGDTGRGPAAAERLEQADQIQENRLAG